MSFLGAWALNWMASASRTAAADTEETFLASAPSRALASLLSSGDWA